jgi:hypothetical protein
MHIQEDDVTANGGWMIFRVVREHVHLTKLFLNNVIKW